jgi:photosystem II stability/assembly factor-like uncharacterized protein
MRTVITLLLFEILAHSAAGQWEFQASGTTARLRGVCAVDAQVAWASGTGGTVLRTLDGGKTWELKVVPDAKNRDFRDIEAFDGRTAYVLSIGEGGLSRIFKTIDGGSNWMLQHGNADPKGFLDALAFWDADHGLALGDAVEGKFVILATDDGGKNWNRASGAGMPAALAGEGAFAASGTCLVVQGDRNAWFGTGGGRIFRSTDRGLTWKVQSTPIRAGNGSAGIFSVLFWDAQHGVAIGGDYKEPERSGNVCVLSSDGGSTWRLPQGALPGGYRSAVLRVPGSTGPTLVAVGPTGTDMSDDAGESWSRLNRHGFHAAAMRAREAGWAVGEAGRIARFDHRQVGPVP